MKRTGSRGNAGGELCLTEFSEFPFECLQLRAEYLVAAVQYGFKSTHEFLF